MSTASKKTKEKGTKKEEVKMKEVKENSNRNRDITGSAYFQVKVFTKKIQELALHLKKYPHDYSSKRGLLRAVVRRRKMLDYLRFNQPDEYSRVLKEVGLKK